MACSINAGRPLGCKDNIGGIRAVYFFNAEDVNTAGDVTIDPTSQEITSITSSASAYKYEVKGANGLSEAITQDASNGTTTYQGTLTVQLKGLDAETRQQVDLLTKGYPRAVVHLRDGKSLFVGLREGLDSSGGTIDTGIEKGDFVGFNLSLQSDEAVPAFFLSGSTIDDPFVGLDEGPTVVE